MVAMQRDVEALEDPRQPHHEEQLEEQDQLLASLARDPGKI